MTDKRKLHPGDHFDTPRSVIEAGDLSREDKVEVLTNWANELRQLQVAEEENMPGKPGLGEQLAAVEQALLELGGDVSHDAKA
ncbi:MAG: hypothetical protein U5Q16_07970 [Gammaproteobacteria bacterium]|nr:hypothetical protein [Gammaproteobacteria bacterium]